MASKNLLLLLALTFLVAYAAAARNLAEARLEDQDIECGKAIGEFSSCSNLTLQFILTGKVNIANCCHAIDDIIRSKCNWPAALTSLGYALEEGNILKAYCNASAAFGTTPSISLNGTITIQSHTTISSVSKIMIM